MNMKRKSFFKNLTLIMMISIFTMLVACGNDDSNNGSDTSDIGDDKTRISFATASTSGAWYPIGGAITSVITDKVDNVEATTEASAASVENARRLADEEVELAIIQPDTAYYAYNGEGEFDEPLSEIRAMFAFTETHAQYLTLDENINDITDFKSHSVGVGAPGSGTEAISNMVLTGQEITYEDIEPKYLSVPEQIDALKDNQLDVSMNHLPIPTGSLTDLSLQHDMKLIAFEGEERAKFIEENPYFYASTIPGGTYSGVDEDVETIAYRGIVSTHTSMSEEDIYNIMKAIFENKDDWVGAHSTADDIGIETALQSVAYPLHPGSVKYLEEVGIDIPEDLLP